MDVKFSENLFLEVKELNRFKKSIIDDGYKRLFKNLIKQYGISESDGNTYFKVSKKLDDANKIVINKGIAFDDDLNAIVLREDRVVDISSISSKSWIVISHDESHDEVGTVDVSEVGVLTGHDTRFTEVLRNGMFPIRVSFSSEKNKYDYEVQSVNSDNTAVLSGYFIAEKNLKYQVVGTFTPGFQPNDSDKHIYTYDDCKIDIIQSDSKPVLDGKHFLICAIDKNNINNSFNIVDWRYFNMLNKPVAGFKSTDSGVSNDFSSIINLLSSTIASVDDRGFSLELILEHGYKIDKYEFVTTSSANIINILSGTGNYIKNTDISDDVFNNYIVINRSNMKKAKILKNKKTQLFLSDFDSDLLNGDDIDLIIVPNYNEVEFEIKVNNNGEMSDVPFYFRKFISSSYRTRNHLDLIYNADVDDMKVDIRYRYIDCDGNTTIFKKLNICGYYSIADGYITLADSSFNIRTKEIKPQEKKRNYS